MASQPTTSNATKPTTSCAAKGCETPQKKKLKRDIQKLRTKLWRKEKKKKLTFKAEVDSLVLQLKKYLPQDTVNFIERQIILQHSAKTGRRYAISDKMLALSVFYQSQKAYKLLSKLFALPSKRTLQKYMQNTNIMPGFNDGVFDALKLKIWILKIGVLLSYLMK